MDSRSAVHFAVLAIVEDATTGDLSSANVAIERATDAGHRVVAQDLASTDAQIRAQLTRWIGQAHNDVVVVVGDDRNATRAALAKLVTEALPGFANVWVARCSSKLVFVLPPSPAAARTAMDTIVLPRLDTRRTDSLTRLIPRFSPAARGKPRTGKNVVKRDHDEDFDPPTKPIDFERLEQQIAMSSADNPTRQVDVAKLAAEARATDGGDDDELALQRPAGAPPKPPPRPPLAIPAAHPPTPRTPALGTPIVKPPPRPEPPPAPRRPPIQTPPMGAPVRPAATPPATPVKPVPRLPPHPPGATDAVVLVSRTPEPAKQPEAVVLVSRNAETVTAEPPSRPPAPTPAPPPLPPPAPPAARSPVDAAWSQPLPRTPDAPAKWPATEPSTLVDPVPVPMPEAPATPPPPPPRKAIATPVAGTPTASPPATIAAPPAAPPARKMVATPVAGTPTASRPEPAPAPPGRQMIATPVAGVPTTSRHEPVPAPPPPAPPGPRKTLATPVAGVPTTTGPEPVPAPPPPRKAIATPVAGTPTVSPPAPPPPAPVVVAAPPPPQPPAPVVAAAPPPPPAPIVVATPAPAPPRPRWEEPADFGAIPEVMSPRAVRADKTVMVIRRGPSKGVIALLLFAAACAAAAAIVVVTHQGKPPPVDAGVAIAHAPVPPPPVPVDTVDAAVEPEIDVELPRDAGATRPVTAPRTPQAPQTPQTPATAPITPRTPPTPPVEPPHPPVTPQTGSATPPLTPVEPAHPLPPGPPPAAGCDEVSCVLDRYARPCCERYKPADTGFDPKKTMPDRLDRTMVKEGVERMKPRVIACGDKHPAKGTVKLSITVGPDGTVSDASVTDAPDPALGECVAAALKKATFGKTINGASFVYPFVF